MPDILHDTAWQFVVLVCLTTLGVFFSWLQYERKSLRWLELANTTLLTVDDELKGNIQLLYDNTPIKDVRLVLLRLLHTGNREIKPGDFIQLLSVGFGPNAKVLSATISAAQPPNNHVTVKAQSNKIEVSKTLLNGGDSITFKVLVSNYQGPLTFEGRVAGVKKINSIRMNSTVPRILYAFFMIYSGFVVLLSSGAMVNFVTSLASLSTDPNARISPSDTVVIVLLTVALMLFFSAAMTFFIASIRSLWRALKSAP